jgi:hypothetical protein
MLAMIGSAYLWVQEGPTDQRRQQAVSDHAASQFQVGAATVRIGEIVGAN